MESLDVSISSITSVSFVDIQDQYDYNEDLVCRYDWDGFHPAEGDRVAIYKTGWLFVKDYFLFEWAPNYLETGTKFVIFNKLCLPKDDKEFYQFCYISAENQVLGASKTFQFTDKIYNYSNVCCDENHLQSLTTDSMSSLKELQNLREENEILKESLKLFMAQKRSHNQDQEINTLKTMVYSLKDIAGKHRNEIEFLKSQVQLCLRANKKLSEENAEIQEKYSHLLKGGDNSNGINSVEIKFKNIELELEKIPPIPALDAKIQRFFQS